MRESLLKG